VCKPCIPRLNGLMSDLLRQQAAGNVNDAWRSKLALPQQQQQQPQQPGLGVAAVANPQIVFVPVQQQQQQQQRSNSTTPYMGPQFNMDVTQAMIAVDQRFVVLLHHQKNFFCRISIYLKSCVSV
jgi:hypothetical protein